MKISIIVATNKNNVIGINGTLPWYIPSDLKFFKQKTLGSPIVMGRATYESIGRPLPGRTNIVLTRNEEYKVEGALVLSSLESALDKLTLGDCEEVFIIGGGQIYREALPLASHLYLTEVDDSRDGDTFFPIVKDAEWRKENETPWMQFPKDQYKFRHLSFNRTDNLS